MFSGSIVALITPMHIDGSIDYAALEKLMAWHIQAKTDAIVLLGTTGESPTIEDHERTELIRFGATHLKGKIPLIIGAGSNSTAHTITYAKEALSLGADAVLLVTPYYNKPTQEGLFQHFSAVAKAVPIPQILYNVPGRTGCDLRPETVARLSQHANIVGLKECAGIDRLKALLSHNLGLRYFSGNDDDGCEFISTGGKGVISVAANVAPELFAKMCHTALASDVDHAEKMNEALRPLYQTLFLESNPIPVKYALAKMGLISPGIRLPLTPLNSAHHPLVDAALKKVIS